MMKSLKKSVISFVFAAVLLVIPSMVSAESVGGISLKMNYQDVVNLYGNPQWCLNDNQSNQYLGEYVENMYVWNNGMTVHFGSDGLSDRVGILKMDAPTDRKLDWSGLGLGNGDPNWWQVYGHVERRGSDLFLHSNAAGEYIWVRYSQGYRINYIEINGYDN